MQMIRINEWLRIKRVKKISHFIILLVVLIEFFSPLTKIDAVTCNFQNPQTGIWSPIGCTMPNGTNPVTGQTQPATPAQTPTTAKPAEEYTVLVNLPGTTKNDNTTNLSTYIRNMFKLVMGIAAVMAFIVITYGGFLYATTDAIQEKEDGRGYITNAIYGLILVLGAYVILYTINPKILDFSIILPKPNITAPAPSVTAK